MKLLDKHYIIPIFVPHLGCPHDCIFCNQRKIASSCTNINEKEIREIIDRYLSYFKKDCFIEIAFYGGSFTAIDIETQRNFLKIALEYKEEGLIDEIRLSTRPDSIDDFILTHLKKYKVDTIELGVQSLSNEVLYKSGRGHTKEDVYRAVELIKKYNFNLGLQMMLGLPGDNLERSLYTAKKFIDLKPQCVRIYPTLVIKETYLQEMVLENKYKALKLEEAVDISTKLLMLFYINEINVIRIGLQPTENIQLGKDVIDGPFHPAFRQLVEANIYKLVLSSFIDENILDIKASRLYIFVNSKNVSNIAGHKSKNIKYLKTKYGFGDIKIYNRDIDQKNIILRIDDYDYKINVNKYMKKYLNKVNIINEENRSV